MSLLRPCRRRWGGVKCPDGLYLTLSCQISLSIDTRNMQIKDFIDEHFFCFIYVHTLFYHFTILFPFANKMVFSFSEIFMCYSKKLEIGDLL